MHPALDVAELPEAGHRCRQARVVAADLLGQCLVARPAPLARVAGLAHAVVQTNAGEHPEIQRTQPCVGYGPWRQGRKEQLVALPAHAASASSRRTKAATT